MLQHMDQNILGISVSAVTVQLTLTDLQTSTWFTIEANAWGRPDAVELEGTRCRTSATAHVRVRPRASSARTRLATGAASSDRVVRGGREKPREILLEISDPTYGVD